MKAMLHDGGPERPPCAVVRPANRPLHGAAGKPEALKPPSMPPLVGSGSVFSFISQMAGDKMTNAVDGMLPQLGALPPAALGAAGTPWMEGAPFGRLGRRGDVALQGTRFFFFRTSATGMALSSACV